MIDTAETLVRWLGAVGLAAAWATAAWGAVKGAGRARGRSSGLARKIGAPAAYAIGGVPFLAVSVLLWRHLPIEPSSTFRAVALGFGTALGAAGLALYLWGRLALGEMYNVSSSLGSELYAPHRLITSGPYRIVRHPMYLGLFLAAAGAFLVYRTWTTVFVIAVLPGAVVKARREERLLAEEFGESFQAYRRRVPGWLPRPPVRSSFHGSRSTPDVRRSS